MPERRGIAGLDQTARVCCFRQGMHAAQSAGRNDGLQRGSLRGVLPVSTSHPSRSCHEARGRQGGGGCLS